MEIPSLATPEGLFDYLIALILLTAALFGLYIALVVYGVVTPLF